jgi:hypothetical protein
MALSGSMWFDHRFARRIAAASAGVYHQFANQRELFGIPNFWNVVSNLPFIAVGAAGLWRFRSDATTIVLFTGTFLTGFGSSLLSLESE